MEQPVGDQKGPAVDRSAALEIGGPAAGLLDEDHRRRRVPRRDVDRDHRLGGTLGEKPVAPEVSEAALAPDRAPSRSRNPGARPDASMSYAEPYRIWASANSVTSETRIGRGAESSALRAHAPPPRRDHHRSWSAGADMTAAWSSPSRSTASSVPNSGTPRMKLWVPSIGSMYQRVAAVPASVPYSSPTRPWSGQAARIRDLMARSIAVSTWVT